MFYGLSRSAPITIVEPGLLLGDVDDAENAALLSKLGVLRVVSVLDAADMASFTPVAGPTYHKHTLADGDGDIVALAQSVYDMLAERETGKAILVHCAMGRSRSASIIIYYFIRKYGWSFKHAFKFLKRKRRVVGPCDVYRDQLRAFAALQRARAP